ncbi:headcase protein homolog isoform X2 [Stigmatopora nigra]
MPNQKNNKGRKSKRTNSSGDEQENGACAAATGGAAVVAAAAASNAAAPGSERSSEFQCATPLVCSSGRPIDREKDDYQRIQCNNELCPFGNWMHLQCFYEWESSILGHLKKDTDWYQVKRMQDERKKKPSERSTGRTGSCGGASGPGDGVFEEPRKRQQPGGAGKPAHRASSQEQPRRQSLDRQNSVERGAGAVGGLFPLGPSLKSPCGSPGQSPPTGFSFSPTAGSGFRGSRQFGEFLKTAVHMEAQRKQLIVGGTLSRASGCIPHLENASVLPLPMAFTLPIHHRIASSSIVDGTLPQPVQFLRRLDLSELVTHIPRHKLNTYHVRMEDDAQVGQGEELRRFILSTLSASQRNVVNCALCHRVLPVFEQFPLVDGTMFLSPSRHDEIEYDVPCHLQGRLMHLYAICVDCLEGVHKIVCIKCKSRWDGSWHQLGTMYTYDILAASPCCQARLNCKHCGKPVVDVRIGMQYFSEYSNVQQCPHCGNLDYHFVKPFSSYKVLEAY